MHETPKPDDAKPAGISRREFARRAALASAIAAVGPAAAIATTPTPTLPLPQLPADLPKLSPEGHAEVDARVQSILGQYGTRFSEAQKADLHRLCHLAQPPLDRLRAYALSNGDAPALYLKPLVEREKNPLENTRVGKTPDTVEKP